MMKVTVECDESVEDEGRFLLDMEKMLRHFYRYDIRVLKAKMGDDSLLRIKRTA